jgi:hypothetical protein
VLDSVFVCILAGGEISCQGHIVNLAVNIGPVTIMQPLS